MEVHPSNGRHQISRYQYRKKDITIKLLYLKKRGFIFSLNSLMNLIIQYLQFCENHFDNLKIDVTYRYLHIF